MLKQTLAQMPLFRLLDAQAMVRLDGRCYWRRAAAKEWIIDLEEEGTDVFFVVAGQVRALIRAISGQSVILGDIQPGEFFGELAAFDGRPRSASIYAITDTTIARMPASVFREMVHEHADVCDQVLRLLTRRMRAILERVSEFSTLGVRHRIYSELVRLSRPDASDDRRAIISPPPFHAEIAARISTRREAVARELKVLERADLLLRRRGALVLTDVRRLVQMIDEAREAD